MLLGATSPIYIGQIAEAIPTPIPPRTRYKLKTTNKLYVGLPFVNIHDSGYIDPQADMKKHIPANTKEFFLPSLIAKSPDKELPF